MLHALWGYSLFLCIALESYIALHWLRNDCHFHNYLHFVFYFDKQILLPSVQTFQ